ncbi:PIG-L deacetylase family protein [Corynebacterium glyciniphilum]|uniref:PIG-L deacetylase family protein n=1 Tax=Corynebacterium glyciniphilum TaxID=1404244 RepID=UPI002652B209|nr:PIG-L deacetylase family protein [Corynebacterium glyciniphilum]MDN6705253.1 PIG-L family deacetylase [Corynebacterium glyciniphilum]
MTDERLELLHLDDSERVLCVVAHPDDMEYGASAAVAEWTDRGIPVTYLLLTSGEAGIDSMAPAETGPARADEQHSACSQVGVEDLRTLGFSDGVLEHSLDLRRAVASVIRDVRPTTVLTLGWDVEMPWGLNQADHRVAGLVALDAARDAGNRWVFPDITSDDGRVLDRWQASQFLVFGSPAPTYAVAVSDESVDRSIASLEQHKVYLAALDDHAAPRDLISGVTSDAGTQAGVDRAVPFRRYEL